MAAGPPTWIACWPRHTLLGVESKLTETPTEHDPVHWRDPYRRPEMRTLLDADWDAVLAASLGGSWQPTHVGLEQLIKHALEVASRSTGERHLVYVWVSSRLVGEVAV